MDVYFLEFQFKYFDLSSVISPSRTASKRWYKSEQFVSLYMTLLRDSQAKKKCIKDRKSKHEGDKTDNTPSFDFDSGAGVDKRTCILKITSIYKRKGDTERLGQNTKWSVLGVRKNVNKPRYFFSSAECISWSRCATEILLFGCFHCFSWDSLCWFLFIFCRSCLSLSSILGFWWEKPILQVLPFCYFDVVSCYQLSLCNILIFKFVFLDSFFFLLCQYILEHIVNSFKRKF